MAAGQYDTTDDAEARASWKEKRKMAQGQFTKEEATATEEAVKELFDAISKAKRPEFIGHLNDIYLFLAAAKKAAPSEAG